MGWIKSEDGKNLVNIANITSISIGWLCNEDDYHVIAEVSSSESYWLAGPKTKDEAEEMLDRIGRWLESGAQGVFQV